MTNTRRNLSAVQIEIISALKKSPYYKKDQTFKKFFSQAVAYEDAFDATHLDTEKEREEKIETRDKLKKDKNFMSVYTGEANAAVSYTVPLTIFDIEIFQCDKANDPTLFQVKFHKTPKDIRFTFSPNSKTSFFRFKINIKGNMKLDDSTLKQFDECSEKYPDFVAFLSKLERDEKNLAPPNHLKLKRSLSI